MAGKKKQAASTEEAADQDELDAAVVIRSSYNSGAVSQTRYGGSYEYDREA